MKSKKSAKDLAFEKERIRLNRTIHVLERRNGLYEKTIIEKERMIIEQRKEISDLIHENEELLKLTQLSKDDLKLILEKEKTKNKINESLLLIKGVARYF